MKKLLFSILAIVLVVILGLRIKDDLVRYQILKSEVNRLIIKNNNLSDEIKRLERLKDQGSKLEVLEREAREMLGFKKEGERVVLVFPLNDQIKNTTTTQDITAKQYVKNIIVLIQNFWYNFRNWLK